MYLLRSTPQSRQASACAVTGATVVAYYLKDFGTRLREVFGNTCFAPLISRQLSVKTLGVSTFSRQSLINEYILQYKYLFVKHFLLKYSKNNRHMQQSFQCPRQSLKVPRELIVFCRMGCERALRAVHHPCQIVFCE